MGANTAPIVALAIALAAAAAACDFRGGAAPSSDDGLTGGKLVAEHAFDQRWSPDDFRTTAPNGWTVVDGQLHTKGTKNAGLWLKQPLPERVRIEFDARSESDDGDIKCEVFTNGHAHESGYVLIFGGWKNKVNAIARLDEHGKDRYDGQAGVQVKKGRTYRMSIVRTDQRLRWYIDGKAFLTLDDPKPLRGPDHQYFGFNDWAVPLYFDNLKIYELPP